ncbi:TPA: hypothetical protein N0F65_007268, partial [Lagenidium giganteum]
EKWLEADDIALCSAWVHATENAVYSNDQTAAVSGTPLYTAFAAQESSQRSRKALRNRWSVIHRDVMKFVRVPAQAERNQQSSSTSDDVITVAEGLYNERFAFVHCWLLLQGCPKFVSPPIPRKRSLNKPTSEYKHGNSDRSRPLGQKAAKLMQTFRF